METEIGNRGSKSIIGMPIHTFVIIVNEQRVDGSWWEKYKNKCISHLRCTLLGLEINFKVSYFPVGGPQCEALRAGEPRGLIHIPLLRYGNETEKIQTYISYSTKIRVPWAKKKLFCVLHPPPLLPPMKTPRGPIHSMAKAMEWIGFLGGKNFHRREEGENHKLDPWFLSGFIDGEGCFVCSIREDKNLKLVPSPPLAPPIDWRYGGGGRGPAGPHRGPPAGVTSWAAFSIKSTWEGSTTFRTDKKFSRWSNL